MTIRDASYTTQPLELLNALGFENPKNHPLLAGDSEINKGVSSSPTSVDNIQVDNHQFDVSDNGKAYPMASPSIVSDGMMRNLNASIVDHNQDMSFQTNSDGSEGCLFTFLL